MKRTEQTKSDLSRRDFIKTTAVTVSTSALVGLSATEAKAQELEIQAAGIPTKWHKEVDVVVVGYGGAGAATAIAAHDLGAKVLILEKAPSEFYAGGNTSVSGGSVYSHQNVADAIKYLTALCGEFTVPPDHIEAWAIKLADNGNFINFLADFISDPSLRAAWRPWEEFPDLPGATNSGCWTAGSREQTVNKGRGVHLWELYHRNVAARGIEVWYSSPGKELIQDADTKEILGIVTEKAGFRTNIKAKKAVVLTCGGFENNLRMIQDFTGLTSCYPFGTPYNTGDGIKMALEVNADLWHLPNVAGLRHSFKAHEFEWSFPSFSLTSQNCILVAKDSKRFKNEGEDERHGKVPFHDRWIPNPMPVPMHAIFDETAKARGPIYSPTTTSNWYGWRELYKWSADNSVEIERGWITVASTIRELATKLNRDPDVLEATVNRYNEFCTTGVDLDFGRAKSQLKPIITPPFYAMVMTPGCLNTQGGPRRNKYAQIVDIQVWRHRSS